MTYASRSLLLHLSVFSCLSELASVTNNWAKSFYLYLFSISHGSRVVPGSEEEKATFTHIHSLVLMCNAPKPQLRSMSIYLWLRVFLTFKMFASNLLHTGIKTLFPATFVHLAMKQN